MHLTFTTKLRIRTVDWAALALLAFEVPSFLFSQYRANSARASEVVATSVLAYFILRLTMREPLRAVWLAVLAGLSGAWLAFTSIQQFASGAQQLTNVGLTDFVAFRSRLIHPISGWVPGECFTILLLALPFATAAAAYLWKASSPKRSKERFGLAALALLPALPIVAALFLSLSRAIFWSTILFFFVACGLMAAYRVITLRTASLLLAGIFGVLLLIMASDTALYPGIFRVYAGSHTSQTRSTQGRVGIWSRSLDLMRAHPLWGVGSSNAGLMLLSSADQEETTGFASRAFSLPIQVLAEKGLSGFALYAAFLLLAGWEFHRGMRLPPLQVAASSVSARMRRKGASRGNTVERVRLQSENAHRAMKCCFAAGLAAVLFRELTYSSLLEHALTLALALSLVALTCSANQPDGLKVKPLAIVVAVVVLLLQWPYRRFDQADAKLGEFYSQVASANFIAARESIDEAIHLWPWNARYYGWRAYLESQQLPSQCTKGSKGERHDLSDKEKEQAQDAAEDYRRSLALNSRDAIAHHNLAWLEHLLGDDAGAARDWRESAEIDPDNAAFHLSYGMFLEESGDAKTAREQYEAAVELTPSILDSPFFAWFRNRSPQAADSMVSKSIARIEARLGRDHDPILEARLGKLYLQAGNIELAGKLLTDAAQQLPNLPLVWFNLGELNEARGDSEQALICYQRAQAIDASLARPYLRMGKIYLQTGQKDSAVHDLNLAIQRWQRNNPTTAAHNNRLYGGPIQRIDDLLPTTLVWFISPCESSEAWSALSQLFPQDKRYAQRTQTCEQIPAPHAGLE